MTSSASGYSIAPLALDERKRLAGALTAEEREIVLLQGTEAPFCGTLLNNKGRGIYTCRLCGLPLFRSDAKFDSGTGWPSAARAATAILATCSRTGRRRRAGAIA